MCLGWGLPRAAQGPIAQVLKVSRPAQAGVLGKPVEGRELQAGRQEGSLEEVFPQGPGRKLEGAAELSPPS